MLKQLRKKRASAILEYMALTLFILAAYLFIEKYLVRGFAGRWRAVGMSFGHGRQFDNRPSYKGGTVACHFDYTTCQPGTGPIKGITPMYGWAPCQTFNMWLSTQCFEDNCDCTVPYDHPAYDAACQSCVAYCVGITSGPDGDWCRYSDP